MYWDLWIILLRKHFLTMSNSLISLFGFVIFCFIRLFLSYFCRSSTERYICQKQSMPSLMRRVSWLRSTLYRHCGLEAFWTTTACYRCPRYGLDFQESLTTACFSLRSSFSLHRLLIGCICTRSCTSNESNGKHPGCRVSFIRWP